MKFDKNYFSVKEGFAPLFVIIGASLWGVDGIVLAPLFLVFLFHW
jgi:hypothetical protein